MARPAELAQRLSEPHRKETHMLKGLGTYTAVAVAVLVAAAFAVPALAGNGTRTVASSITFASIDGAAAPASPTTKMGDSLSFATTVQPLAGWQHPMVGVSCYQDVNGDGVINTSVTGPDVVYTQLDKPSASFMLGGYSSPWIDRGGSAVCRADLYSYGFKSGIEYTQVLATTGNWSSAG
jgi:hypothetical protein